MSKFAAGNLVVRKRDQRHTANWPHGGKTMRVRKVSGCRIKLDLVGIDSSVIENTDYWSEDNFDLSLYQNPKPIQDQFAAAILPRQEKRLLCLRLIIKLAVLRLPANLVTAKKCHLVRTILIR